MGEHIQEKTENNTGRCTHHTGKQKNIQDSDTVGHAQLHEEVRPQTFSAPAFKTYGFECLTFD